MTRPNADAIYESAPGDDRELARAIRVCLMGTAAFPALTFFPDNGDEAAFRLMWAAWHEALFVNVLGPHLVRCHQAARVNQIAELLEADRELDARLTVAQRDRSASAGAALHGSIEGARHVPQMDRFRHAVLEQQVPGHFATVLAVEAALFYVPLMHVLPACLFAEWRGARISITATAGHSARGGGSISEFLGAAGEEVFSSRKTLDSSLAGSGQLIVCA